MRENPYELGPMLGANMLDNYKSTWLAADFEGLDMRDKAKDVLARVYGTHELGVEMLRQASPKGMTEEDFIRNGFALRPQATPEEAAVLTSGWREQIRRRTEAIKPIVLRI